MQGFLLVKSEPFLMTAWEAISLLEQSGEMNQQSATQIRACLMAGGSIPEYLSVEAGMVWLVQLTPPSLMIH
jgi:hypothetical protein